MKKYLKSIVLLVFVLFSYQNALFANENNNLFIEYVEKSKKINDEQILNLQEMIKKIIQRDQQHQEEIETLNNKIKELEEYNLFFKKSYAQLRARYHMLLKQKNRMELENKKKKNKKEVKIQITDNDLPEYIKKLEKQCLEQKKARENIKNQDDIKGMDNESESSNLLEEQNEKED